MNFIRESLTTACFILSSLLLPSWPNAVSLVYQYPVCVCLSVLTVILSCRWCHSALQSALGRHFCPNHNHVRLLPCIAFSRFVRSARPVIDDCNGLSINILHLLLGGWGGCQQRGASERRRGQKPSLRRCLERLLCANKMPQAGCFSNYHHCIRSWSRLMLILELPLWQAITGSTGFICYWWDCNQWTAWRSLAFLSYHCQLL